MSRADATRAVNELKDLVLQDPELLEIAKNAQSLDDFKQLWGVERFRAAHEKAVAGVSHQDVVDHLAELSDEQLDGVAGGVLIGLNQPALKANPRDTYPLALGIAVMQDIKGGSHGVLF